MVVDGFGGYSHPTALRAVRILRRGWWIILLTTVAVAGVAYYQSSRQAGAVQRLLAGPPQVPEPRERPHRDPGSLDRLPGSAAGRPDADADRDVTRRREPGRRGGQDPGADRRLVPRQRKRHGRDRLRTSSNFNITYGDAETAARLATIHAQEFIRAPARARHGVARRRPQGAPWADRRARADGVQGLAPLVAELVENEQALRTMEALQTANASLLRPAERRGADPAAHETRRRARRDARPHARASGSPSPAMPSTRVFAPRRRSATGSGRRCSRGSPLRRERFAARTGS